MALFGLIGSRVTVKWHWICIGLVELSFIGSKVICVVIHWYKSNMSGIMWFDLHHSDFLLAGISVVNKYSEWGSVVQLEAQRQSSGTGIVLDWLSDHSLAVQ